MKTKQIIKALRNYDKPFIDVKLATEAANRLEMLSVEQKKLHAKLKAMKADLAWAVKYLHDGGGCAGCKYEDEQETAEPCAHCQRITLQGDDLWEFHGAEDTNVPSKEE